METLQSCWLSSSTFRLGFCAWESYGHVWSLLNWLEKMSLQVSVCHSLSLSVCKTGLDLSNPDLSSCQGHKWWGSQMWNVLRKVHSTVKSRNDNNNAQATWQLLVSLLYYSCANIFTVQHVACCANIFTVQHCMLCKYAFVSKETERTSVTVSLSHTISHRSYAYVQHGLL